MKKTPSPIIYAGLILALISIGYFFLDRPISLVAYELRDTFWHTLAVNVSKFSNHFVTNVLVAAGLVYASWDGIKNGLTHRSKSIIYICATVACAMIIGDTFKELCGRARPPLLFEKGIYGFFPMSGGYLHHSFPSGHTLRIFSSMTAVGFILPRLRVPALTLAVLVGASRVFALKHYPSDVLFGAAIGITTAVCGWHLFASALSDKSSRN
ncbi:phosphatase PAP2 family protein [Desulfovibrio sp. JC010]|uniref:phosphatase PAP2 family protein n=1 Tax=Desulfovibrio sp. JC010 TaxID=2593641 RepID=UPI0013D5107A|nr:phosphatase PAP2 family protein [Desulfovibrio sp. JC010]NDV28585.1 phosphatase PAP2 family protein [Desulfovibrio sp. JC010]